jgi:general stress protein 26
MTHHEAHGTDETRKVAELVDGIRIAMLTTREGDRLVSRPLATQDVEFDGDVWFVTERSASWVSQLETHPEVNVAFSGSSTWVSLSGTAKVVDDVERLKEYWNTFTDAWLEGGPETPENVLVHVEAHSAEYWDTPGSKVTQVVNLVKAKATGERYEADSGVVDLDKP